MKDWERLFARALQVVDAAQRTAQRGIVWSLGGGSALMRRHRHRHSAGVDLFLRDARMLPCVSPRLNQALGDLGVDYVEESTTIRLYFPEGEVAFIACGFVTPDPVRRESILGRSVLVETSSEILARKFSHRAASLPARDLFDFAAVAAFEPAALRDVGGELRARRAVLLDHLREHGAALREDFAALHAWEFHPSFEECVGVLRTELARRLPPPVVEQERGRYGMARLAGEPIERNHRYRPSRSRHIVIAGQPSISRCRATAGTRPVNPARPQALYYNRSLVVLHPPRHAHFGPPAPSCRAAASRLLRTDQADQERGGQARP